MIYLIRSFGRKGKSYLKAGWTDNLTFRMGKYRVDNPFFELITKREGTRSQEKLLHLYLTALELKAEFMDEWFLDTSQTLSEFHVSWEKAERVVWRYRSSLFTALDFARKNIKCRVYEDLRFLHRYEKLERNPIDIAWKRNSLKNYIKTHDLQTTDCFFETNCYQFDFREVE